MEASDLSTHGGIMKFMMIFAILFITGILFGYYSSNDGKTPAKSYKLPATLQMQVQEVVNRDLQIRARYQSPVYIHQRNVRIYRM